MKAAIIIIDMQKAYYSGPIKESMDRAAEIINPAVELFRAKSLPVIWTQGVDPEDGAAPGRPGFEIVDILNFRDSDMFIKNKEYNNAFNKTQLLDFLLSQSVDTLFITGFSAEHCVLSTCRAAKDHDLTPVLLRNGLAGRDQVNINFVEKINDIISFDALRRVLE